MLRRECKLEPRYREWQQSGISSSLTKSDAEQSVVAFIANINDIPQDTIHQFVHKYSVRDEPNRYAYLASSDEPRSRILALTFEELDAILAEGLVTERS